MAPLRSSKRPRQMRDITNVLKSSPEVNKPLTKSPIDSRSIKMTSDDIRSPESLRFVAPEPICIKELSPKIIPRASKLKLNFDIPEEEPEDEANCPKNNINILERTISIDKVYDDMGFLMDHANFRHFVSPKDEPQDKMADNFSGRKIDKNDENLSNDQKQQMAIVCQNDEFSSIKSIDLSVKSVNRLDKFFISTFGGKSSGKSCRRNLEIDEVKISSEERKEFGVDELKCGTGGLEEGFKITWQGSGGSEGSPEGKEARGKTISLTMETTDPQVHIDNQSESDNDIIEEGMRLRMRVRKYWRPVEKVVEFIEWLGERVIIFVKKGCRIVSWGMFSSSGRKRREQGGLEKVLEDVRRENQMMVGEISERINCLSKKLVQTSTTNQTSLSALTKEVETIKTTNQQLLNSNEILMRELKTLSEALNTFKSITRVPVPPATVGSSIPSPPPISGLFGPPPPPPMPQFLLNTPKNPFMPTKKSPTKKCSTPLIEARPVITVEDLLKVTLKKAPQQHKESRKTPLDVKKGPVVSLDMLRSVKLKSARRRSSDNAKSPCRVHPYKTLRNTQSLTSLSPISARERSPLHRILREVDGTQGRVKRMIISPTQSSQSDHETSQEGRKIDAMCNKSHSIIT